MPLINRNQPSSRLFSLIGIVLISLVLFSFIALLFVDVFNLKNAPNDLYGHLDNQAVVDYLKFSQVLSAIGIFFIPPIVLSFLTGEKIADALHIRKAPGILALIISSGLMIVCLPLINITAFWNEHIVFPESLQVIESSFRDMEDSAKKITEAFLKMSDSGDFILTIFIMAVLPAIGEEFLFRGTLQPILVNLTNPKLAIWITAFVFSFIHFQFFGFIPRFLLGALLGYLFYYSSNVWYPVIAHFTNNALAICGSYLEQHKIISFAPDEIGIGEFEFVILIFLVPVIILSMRYFIRLTKKSTLLPGIGDSY